MSTPSASSPSSDLPAVSAATPRVELLAIHGILALSLGLRLLFISAVPTVPYSDFRSRVAFGESLRDTLWSDGSWHWNLLGAGLPTALAVLFKLLPFASSDALARLATAVVSGLLPAIPLFLWRRVVSLPVRVVAAGLLALWPGQIALSGVVAQDNWVMVPTVALAALAVRSLIRRESHPLWAALLFCLAVWIRQEMLVANLPLALAAGLGSRQGFRKHLGIFAATTAACLLLVGGQRAMGTGHFALTTRHGGASILGAYLAQESGDLWVDPVQHIVRRHPEAAQNPDLRNSLALRMAVGEAMRRPLYHAIRMTRGAFASWLRADTGSFYWSMTCPEVIPPELQPRAHRVASLLEYPSRGFLLGIHGLFLIAVVVAIRKRNLPVLVLALAVFLKGALHAVLVAQPRYFLPVISLECLAIPLGLGLWWLERPVHRVVIAAGALVALGSVVGFLRWAPGYLTTRAEPPETSQTPGET